MSVLLVGGEATPLLESSDAVFDSDAGSCEHGVNRPVFSSDPGGCWGLVTAPVSSVVLGLELGGWDVAELAVHRRLLNQSTHARVSSSTCSECRRDPRRWMRRGLPTGC